MICKICLDKTSSGKKKYKSACLVWRVMAGSDPLSFEENEFERRFYLNVCDSHPGYGYTGSNME